LNLRLEKCSTRKDSLITPIQELCYIYTLLSLHDDLKLTTRKYHSASLPDSNCTERK